MWYDGTPAERANYFAFCADRARDAIARTDREISSGRRAQMPWTASELADRKTNVRSLDAAAKVFAASSAGRAGDVDDFGLSDPTFPRSLKAKLVDAILSDADPLAIDMLAYRPLVIEGKVTIALSKSPDAVEDLTWCEVRSVPDEDGAFLVYAINGFWTGMFDPKAHSIVIDGLEELPDPAFEIWRGEVPFGSHFPDQALAWIHEQIESRFPTPKQPAREIDNDPNF